MSDDCCQNKGKDLENIQKQHSNILWIVLFYKSNNVCYRNCEWF